jgi:hypothetical protein
MTTALKFLAAEKDSIADLVLDADSPKEWWHRMARSESSRRESEVAL